MRSLIDTDGKILIIAEAGVNHNGDKANAFALIDVAAEAGADAVKFQTFSTASVVSPSAPKAQYQIDNTSEEETQTEMLKKLELPFEWHRELQLYCEKRGILFTSTPFHPEAADFLASLELPFLKVSSTDLNNIPYLTYLAGKNIPLLVSTGMSTMEEVAAAVAAIDTAGCPNWGLLHCLSQYPAPHSEANLRAIPAMATAFNCPVGYSDHTLGSETALVAVGLGATLFEKHFTLDKTMEGPDHKASASPEELANYISAIRVAESALGDGVKICQPSETSTRAMARKSLTAAHDLSPGHILKDADLVLLRPADGIEPRHLPDVIGRTVKTSITAGRSLTWDDLA